MNILQEQDLQRFERRMHGEIVKYLNTTGGKEQGPYYVNKYLTIGNIKDTRDVDLLRRCGIKAIINLYL